MTLSGQQTVYLGQELCTGTSIRLLKVHVASETTSPIQCTLQTFDLKNKPRYTALSYTWGPPIKTIYPLDESFPTELQTILRNDQPFSVTQNLHDALSELHQSDFTEWLWVDAISINQSDFKERADQVALMADIYYSATETVAWLGKDETGAEHLQWAIDVLIPELVRRNFNHRAPWDPDLPLVSGVEGLLGKLIRIIMFLATHRWFHRAWVAQEVALSRAIRVRCGRWQFSWDDLHNVYYTLNGINAHCLGLNSGDLPSQQESFARATTLVFRISRLRALIAFMTRSVQESLISRKLQGEIELVKWTYGMRTDIEKATAWMCHLLSEIRHLESSERHDKIYSILGLTTFFSPLKFQLVKADYSIPADELYTTVTATMILNCQFLGILTNVGDFAKNRTMDLPSWVVDYSYSSATHSLCDLGVRLLFSFDERMTSTLPPPLRKVEGTRLTLEGTVLDHIVVVSPSIWDEIISDSSHHLQKFGEFLSCLPHHYFNGQTRAEALWRVLMLDREFKESSEIDSPPAHSSWSHAFLLWILVMCREKLVEEEGLVSTHEDIKRPFLQFFDSSEL
jgi:Heterokaryon incompatibility protein (HET)